MKELNADQALIFRIVHANNVPWILDQGLHCRNSSTVDPNFTPIGNPELIEKRRGRLVPIAPGGSLSDYVPFYFTPHSIMLYNIRTGYGGIAVIPNPEIVILVSSLRRLGQLGIGFVFTDRHAYLASAQFFSDLRDLGWIDWELLRARDFRNNPDQPEKKEKYQAEALAHRRVPVAGLLGLICYDEAAKTRLEKQIEKRRIELQTFVRPECYFQ